MPTFVYVNVASFNEARIVRVIKSTTTTWLAAYYWEKLKESNHFEDLGVDERIILKVILKKQRMEERGLDSSVLKRFTPRISYMVYLYSPTRKGNRIMIVFFTHTAHSVMDPCGALVNTILTEESLP